MSNRFNEEFIFNACANVCIDCSAAFNLRCCVSVPENCVLLLLLVPVEDDKSSEDGETNARSLLRCLPAKRLRRTIRVYRCVCGEANTCTAILAKPTWVMPLSLKSNTRIDRLWCSAMATMCAPRSRSWLPDKSSTYKQWQVRSGLSNRQSGRSFQFYTYDGNWGFTLRTRPQNSSYT